jgi:hypothetical protein
MRPRLRCARATTTAASASNAPTTTAASSTGTAGVPSAAAAAAGRLANDAQARLHVLAVRQIPAVFELSFARTAAIVQHRAQARERVPAVRRGSL